MSSYAESLRLKWRPHIAAEDDEDPLLKKLGKVITPDRNPSAGRTRIMIMDGFQQSAAQAQSNAGRTRVSSLQEKRTAWNRALKSFERSVEAITPVMNEHAEADDAMFATRRELESLALPAALAVSIAVEMYFNDGMSPPILRRSRQTAELKDEADIQAFAKDDVALKTRLLAALRSYDRKRAPLEASYQKAKARSEAAEAKSSAVIDRSDTKQLRLFRTPAPGLNELALKIEMLHRADCSSYVEKQGWLYVLEELATFASDVPEQTTPMPFNP